MQNESATEGKCKQMCPESEIAMREQQRLLHPMEVLRGTQKQIMPKADRTKIVKEFCRSSAGQRMQKPEILRPYTVLLDTVSYLLNDAMLNEDFPWHVRYDFITDRLRAVRQDMVIQDIPKPQAICLLQPIVRFYAYASYRMSNTMQKFDPHLNNKHFQECIKRLLAMYDECEEFSNRCQFLNYATVYEDSRPQIEAIYILFNLGDDEALLRALSLAPRWKLTSEVHSALKISLLYRNKNVVAVCRQIAELPHLLAAVAVLHLPAIRKVCFQIMTCSYNSKNLQFPLERLQELMHYSTIGDLLEDLAACGINYNLAWDEDSIVDTNKGKKYGGVIFTKGQFKNVKLGLHDTRFVDAKLQDVCVDELVLIGI